MYFYFQPSRKQINNQDSLIYSGVGRLFSFPINHIQFTTAIEVITGGSIINTAMVRLDANSAFKGNIEDVHLLCCMSSKLG